MTLNSLEYFKPIFPNTVSYAGTMLGVEFRDSGAKRMSLREDLCARVNLLVKEVRKGDP